MNTQKHTVHGEGHTHVQNTRNIHRLSATVYQFEKQFEVWKRKLEELTKAKLDAWKPRK